MNSKNARYSWLEKLQGDESESPEEPSQAPPMLAFFKRDGHIVCGFMAQR